MNNVPLHLAALALACALLAGCGRSDTLTPLAQEETATVSVATATTIVDETATLVAAIATQDALFPQQPAVLITIAAPERQTAVALKQTALQADMDRNATDAALPALMATLTPQTYITLTPEPTLNGYLYGPLR
jgi:hypothetical protein